MTDRQAEIRRRLEGALAPESLELIDDSAQHVGHTGAKGGGGHYSLTIVSPRFSGEPMVSRHRLVYQALGDLMGREIHALSINAYSPDEI